MYMNRSKSKMIDDEEKIEFMKETSIVRFSKHCDDIDMEVLVTAAKDHLRSDLEVTRSTDFALSSRHPALSASNHWCAFAFARCGISGPFDESWLQI